MKIKFATSAALLWVTILCAQTSEKPKLPVVRFQLKFAEYCMGSVYNGGFMCVQSGIRAETFLLKGKLIPEIQYNRGWFDLEKLSFPNEYMKPFSDLKVGVRFGKFSAGDATFRNLKCIDRTIREGNMEITYYEDDNVRGDLHVGFAGGIYMSKAFLKSGFTKESEIDASVSLNAASVYAGIALTKWVDNAATKYSSGNTCIWDKYALYYFNVMYAFQHTIGEMYYTAGQPSPIAGSQAYSYANSVEDKLRDFRPFGFMMGFEGGRWRKGFVGSYEVGMIPSLKGKGFFFKVGATIAIGVG